jgi:streptomycin 6-kinase
VRRDYPGAPVADELAQIADWRANVAELVTDCCERWELRPGEPYVPGVCGHVVRVELADGTPAVLKVFWPHHEAEQEADALERWDGDGAVRLYARDNDRHALLLERCEPGSFLSTAADPLGVLIELLPRLWRSCEGFVPLEVETEQWAAYMQEAKDHRFRDIALEYIRELAPTQGEQVLVNQDLHGENVLAAERQPWLAIDPKPLAGEREFSASSIVRSSELGHSKRHVLNRLDRMCSELGLDRDRAKGWTIAQTIAWSGGSDYVNIHMETVQWLLEDA